MLIHLLDGVRLCIPWPKVGYPVSGPLLFLYVEIARSIRQIGSALPYCATRLASPFQPVCFARPYQDHSLPGAQIEKVSNMVYSLGLSGRFEDYNHMWPSTATAISTLMVNEYDFFARPPVPNGDNNVYGPAWHKPYHFLAQTVLNAGYTKDIACRALDVII